MGRVHKRSGVNKHNKRKIRPRTRNQRIFFIRFLFLLSLLNIDKEKSDSVKDSPLAPHAHDHECVFCQRKIWQTVRTLKVEDFNENKRKNAETWCYKNGLSMNDLDGRYACARDVLRLSNGKLPDITKKSGKPPVFINPNCTNPQEEIPPPPKSTGITLKDIKNVPNSGKKCVVCNTAVVASCVKVPYFARMELLLDFQLLLPSESNCRVCSSHLDGEHLCKDMKISREYGEFGCTLNEENAVKLVTDLIEGMQKYRKLAHLNFETDGALTDEDYRLWTGWTKAQFDEMASQLNGVNKSNIRTKREALAMFWIKLKTDLSCSQIASLFNIHDPNAGGRIIVSRSVESVADSMDKVYLFLYLLNFQSKILFFW
eukprot:Lithocolla_globosa_v1_NODE_456_length_3997_cov_19.695840.p2 type:complete len:372 gc:universal NODE_456_length_3997_cov_19.695840:3415-2300(-)